ncbi:MAG: choice-of-anchor W domain-containing protein [Candidatus Krumholzibacteriia bacterium]
MTKIAKAFLPVLALMALCSPPPATAQLAVEYFSSDAILATVLSDSLFVAEGRIGDLGGAATFELDLGASTASPATTSQLAWGNDVAYPFALSFDHVSRMATFTVGGHTLSYTSTYQVFDAIFIRTRSLYAGTFVGVFNLTLDGIPVPGASIENIANGLKIMQIYGAPLQDGFTLSGTVKLGWTGNPPLNSDLAFQIFAANMLVVGNEDQSWGQVKNLFR